jgi:hypothetical protein
MSTAAVTPNNPNSTQDPTLAAILAAASQMPAGSSMPAGLTPTPPAGTTPAPNWDGSNSSTSPASPNLQNILSASRNLSAGPTMPASLSSAINASNTVPAPLAPALGSSSPSTSSGTADLESRLPSNLSLGVAADTEKNIPYAERTAPYPTDARLDQMAAAAGTNPDENSPLHQGFLDRLRGFATPQGISGILGGFGTALALAKGSPEQKKLALEQEQIPIKQQQAQNEAAWHQEMARIQQQNANTKGNVAGTGSTKVAGILAQHGQKEDADGNVVPLEKGDPGYEMFAAQQQANLQKAQATAYRLDQQGKSIQAAREGKVYVTPEVAEAYNRPDLAGKNISNLEFQQNIENLGKMQHTKVVDLGPDEGQVLISTDDGHVIKKLADYSHVGNEDKNAADRVKVEMQRAQQAQQAGNMVLGRSGGRQVAVSSADAGNITWDPGYSPVKVGAAEGEKIQNARKLTTLFNNPDPEHPGTIQLADKLDREGKLGPIASRYQDYINHTGSVVGFDSGDLDFQRLMTNLGLQETALMQAHVGSRGGSYLMDHFHDLANAKAMSGPAFRAALDTESRYADTMAMNPYPSIAAPNSPGNSNAPKNAANKTNAGATKLVGKANKYE